MSGNWHQQRGGGQSQNQGKKKTQGGGKATPQRGRGGHSITSPRDYTHQSSTDSQQGRPHFRQKNKPSPPEDGFVFVPNQSVDYLPQSPLLQLPSQLLTVGHVNFAAKQAIDNLKHLVLGESQRPDPEKFNRERTFPNEEKKSASKGKNPMFKAKPYAIPSTSKNQNASQNEIKEQKKKSRSKRSRKSQARPQFDNTSISQQPKKKNQPVTQQDLLTFSRVTKQVSTTALSDGDDSLESSTNTAHSSAIGSPEIPVESDTSSSDDSCSEESASSQQESLDISTNSPKSVINSWMSLTGEERFVSVFWDIENCPVPSNKSAVDIVKKIRNTFYEGRTEVTFKVACDTRRLSDQVEKELTESQVTIVHASSQSKNAADSKLQGFLCEFQYQYRMKNSAVVLISGDSDFSSFLNDMRYKHHIHIYLICNKTARKALREAAHSFKLYEDFIQDLPPRLKEESKQYYLIVTDLPSHIKKSAIKSFFTDKMKGINGRVKEVMPTQVELLFTNASMCQKALNVIKGIDVYGSKVSVKMETRDIQSSQVGCSSTMGADILKNPDHNISTVQSSKENEMVGVVDKMEAIAAKVQPVKKVEVVKPGSESCGKSATLYVFVTNQEGNVTYWEKEFAKLFGNEEISIQWCGTGLVGYFLVKFKSLSKAQKARKLLEANQRDDKFAPRFLKLVKDDDGMDKLLNIEQDLKEITMKQIDEKIQCVQMKKEKCLNKFKSVWDSIRHAQNNDSAIGNASRVTSAEYSNALTNRQNELNEQKVTFLNITENTCQKLKGLDISAENIDVLIEDIMKDYCRECSSFENGLPLYAKKKLIVKKVRGHQVVVIQADAGSGKSTQICQYLWREGFGNSGLIVCTQPKRIAAMSLAKHVSSQVGCSLGSIVGYKVSNTAKIFNQTKILFVTDLIMLDMCMDDPLFNKISCIIIDEAHERSVYSDLLLGMIKRSLHLRPDIRIVITSTVSKVCEFQHYFNLSDDAIIKISTCAFPVETLWIDSDVSLGWNYFEKTLTTAYDLLNEPPGDILVFLATPSETEKAVERFNDMVKSKGCYVQIYQMHEMVDVQQQQKVFEKTSPDIRKIVFATSLAESTLTIPGIKYVVDVGMVKEPQYDAVHNLNVIAIGFVSKRSADQRSSCASHVQNGKCYRLYSQNNYQNEMVDVIPEISRVELRQAILKLMRLGVKNVLEFDYVHAPSNNLLTATIKQLIQIGAVDGVNYKLTKLGSQIAALPLEPSLCHLILMGIEKGIGYETLVIASLAAISRHISFCTSRRKVQFVQSESDYFSFLKVYKEWLDVPKAGRTHWCSLNSISDNFMKLAHQLVNELISVFSNDLGIKIPTKFADKADIWEAIKKTIIICFSQNLCVFSDHNRIGYFSPDIPGSLHIHSLSSLYGLGKSPRYVVYETVLKTFQLSLVNVTAVDDDTLEVAIKDEHLCIDLNRYRNMPMLKPCVLSGLGHNTLKNLVGPKEAVLKSFENKFTDMCNGENCIITADFNNGQLKVFAPSRFHKVVVDIFSPIINELRTQFLSEEAVVINFVDVSSLTAAVGAGGDIHDVILLREYRDVKIKPKSNASVVMQQLMRFGDVVSTRETQKCQYVTFRTVADAQNAYNRLEKGDAPFTVTPETAVVLPEPTSFFKIRITVIHRPCVSRAFFNVSPASDVQLVLYNLSHSVVKCQSKCLEFAMSTKNRNDICISNLPENVSENELKSSILKYFPGNLNISHLTIEHTKEHGGGTLDVVSLRSRIHNLFAKFTQPHLLKVDVKPPKPKDKNPSILIYFENPQDGQNAVNILNSTCSFNYDEVIREVTEIKPLLETNLYCSNEVFAAVKVQIGNALELLSKGSHESNQLDIVANKSKDGKAVIFHISSNNVADIITAKKTIQQILRGNIIDCAGNSRLEILFTQKGQEFIKSLQSRVPDSYIHLNHHSKVISIYGCDSSHAVVRSSLDDYLDHLTRQPAVTMNIPLKVPNNKKNVIKEIVTQYGLNLEKLCLAYNPSSAKIDVLTQMLIISGNEGSLLRCQSMVTNLMNEIGDYAKPSSDRDECPICHGKVVPPVHRLEYCGHLYCDLCLLCHLQFAGETPILCCVESCKKPIVWKDLVWAVGKVKPLVKKIHSAAFDTMMRRRQDVRFCPVPSCPMIYRISTVDQKCGVPCSLCQNDICTKCGVLYHAGMTCEFYRLSETNNHRLLQVWLQNDRKNRNLCPACRSPIERCRTSVHMTCWKCKLHVCWSCMKTFKHGDDAIVHAPLCGGI